MEGVAREVGVSKGTISAWKARVRRIDVNQAHEGKQLRDEHEALKEPVADSRLDKNALQWTRKPNHKRQRQMTS
jgi:putative transposase